MTSDDLLLRPCAVDDARELAEMYARDRVEIDAAEPGRAPSFFEREGQVDRITRVWAEYGTLGYVSVRDHRIVGLFLLEDRTGDSAIVAYYVSSSHRRAGVATRALAQLVEIARGDVGLRVLITDIRPDNIASIKVAERNRFRAGGNVTIEGVEHHRFVRDLTHDAVPADRRAGESPRA